MTDKVALTYLPWLVALLAAVILAVSKLITNEIITLRKDEILLRGMVEGMVPAWVSFLYLLGLVGFSISFFWALQIHWWAPGIAPALYLLTCLIPSKILEMKRLSNDGPYKKCVSCGRVRPSLDFNCEPSSPDGRHSLCVPCAWMQPVKAEDRHAIVPAVATNSVVLSENAELARKQRLKDVDETTLSQMSDGSPATNVENSTPRNLRDRKKLEEQRQRESERRRHEEKVRMKVEEDATRKQPCGLEDVTQAQLQKVSDGIPLDPPPRAFVVAGPLVIFNREGNRKCELLQREFAVVEYTNGDFGPLIYRYHSSSLEHAEWIAARLNDSPSRREAELILARLIDTDPAAFPPERWTPFDSFGYLSRGKQWLGKKECDKAIKDFGEAIRLNPRNAEAYGTLAWLLATCPEERVRDGSAAIQMAMKACELTNWKSSWELNTLAAAFAEAGRFDEAVRYQTEALQALPKGDGPNPGRLTGTSRLQRGLSGLVQASTQARLDEFCERLELYKQKKPFRQAPDRHSACPMLEAERRRQNEQRQRRESEAAETGLPQWMTRRDQERQQRDTEQAVEQKERKRQLDDARVRAVAKETPTQPPSVVNDDPHVLAPGGGWLPKSMVEAMKKEKLSPEPVKLVESSPVVQASATPFPAAPPAELSKHAQFWSKTLLAKPRDQWKDFLTKRGLAPDPAREIVAELTQAFLEKSVETSTSGQLPTPESEEPQPPLARREQERQQRDTKKKVERKRQKEAKKTRGDTEASHKRPRSAERVDLAEVGETAGCRGQDASGGTGFNPIGEATNCTECGEPAVTGVRGDGQSLCLKCLRKAIAKETPMIGHYHKHRSAEMRENIRETKYGRDR